MLTATSSTGVAGPQILLDISTSSTLTAARRRERQRVCSGCASRKRLDQVPESSASKDCREVRVTILGHLVAGWRGASAALRLTSRAMLADIFAMPIYGRPFEPGQLQFITSSTYRRSRLFACQRF